MSLTAVLLSESFWKKSRFLRPTAKGIGIERTGRRKCGRDDGGRGLAGPHDDIVDADLKGFGQGGA